MQALSALGALAALRPGEALGPLAALRSLDAHRALESLRALGADISLKTLWARDSLEPLWALTPAPTLRASVTLEALDADGALGSLRTGRALEPLSASVPYPAGRTATPAPTAQSASVQNQLLADSIAALARRRDLQLKLAGLDAHDDRRRASHRNGSPRPRHDDYRHACGERPGEPPAMAAASRRGRRTQRTKIHS